MAIIVASTVQTYSEVKVRNKNKLSRVFRFMRKALLDSENGAAAAATPGQLLAGWPDTCLLISCWLGHVEIAKALLDKGAPVSTSDCDGRYICT